MLAKQGILTEEEKKQIIDGLNGIREDVENGKLEITDKYEDEILTFVPIDLDAIDATIMTTEEKELLNAYHKDVYSIVSPYLNDEEKEWLRLYTREV